MNALEAVLPEFTAELGMGEVAIAPDQPAVFRFERSGRLFVEQRGERILVYLEAPDPVDDPKALIRALAACDLRHRRPQPVRAALTGDDRPVFGIAFQEDEFTLQSLHQAIELLMAMHDDLRGAASSI